jgi:hypothetical protein
MSRCQPMCQPESEEAHSIHASARSQSRRPMRAARFLTALLAMVCVAAADASHAAGRVFSDGFESGNTNQWSADGLRNKCTLVGSARDGGAPHSGNSMLECNWNGTVLWSDPAAYSTMVLPQSSWNYSREFLIRLWVRFDADVNHVDGDKLLRLYPHDNLESFFVAARMNVPGGPMFVFWEQVNGKAGPEFWGGSTQLGDTRWHKLEIYVKHNSVGAADGVLRVWLDGNVAQEATNIVSVAPDHQWGPLHLMSNWSNNPGWEHGATNHVYWDDIEVYTDRASGASGLMADATITGGSSTPTPDPPHSVSVR